MLFVSLKNNNKFLRFCLCTFESDTVKTDCPVLISRKMIKHLKVYNRLFDLPN